MDRFTLEVAQDHILSLTRIRKPIVAVEELVWNALDEDATEVRIDIEHNRLDGLQAIVVSDNGNGLPRGRCQDAFGRIGGSPKLNIHTTPAGRVPHGKLGRGRFRAFGIGHTVTWTSRYAEGDTIIEYQVKCHRSSIRDVEVTGATKASVQAAGMHVRISGIESNFPSLMDAEAAASELALRLALYLRKYPGILVRYDGVLVDPASMEDCVQNYDLEIPLPTKEVIPGQLTVIEWKRSIPRALYLCDENGFALDEHVPGIQAKGYDFTAYLKCSTVSELEKTAALGAGELHPTVKALLDASKDCLKSHFRKRDATRVSDLVRKWQEERVYPYQALHTDPLEEAEREVFDVCAAKVHEYLPGFDTAERKSKQLTFRLLRQALETSPTSLQAILREILALPREQQDELAQLLERTSLSALINAASVVVERLHFLQSLDQLLFGDFKDKVLERQHLHRILSGELWIFGEQYQRGVDEESLTNLLRKHVSLLEREELVPTDEPVTDLDGKTRRLDLMLYSRFPLQPGCFEHLVIELKRPRLDLGQEEISQIEKYAFAVAADERFNTEQVRWTFLLLGNDLDDFAAQKCDIRDREFGHIHSGRVNIHVNRWSAVLEQARWRYEFFRSRLEYKATSNDGLAYVRQKYGQNLPEVLVSDAPVRQSRRTRKGAAVTATATRQTAKQNGSSRKRVPKK